MKHKKSSILPLVVVLMSCFLLPIASSAEYARTIYIDPSTGENLPECLEPSNPPSPCRDLTWVFQQGYKDSTHYVLSEGSHSLTGSIPLFKDLAHQAFSGASSTVVNCTDTGLAFINTINIAFHNISFFNCAALRNSTSRNFTDGTTILFRVGLYFYLCESINMSHVAVTGSPNGTGVVVYDTNGTNTISYSSFSNNSVSEGGDHSGGGGFYIEFTYCEPGTCNAATVKRNKGASYTFISCEFNYNRADNVVSSEFLMYIVPHREDHVAFGRGGGLSLFIKGSASGNMFTFQKCQFIDNVALWGGGLFVEFQDDVHSNTINVNESSFIWNKCLYSTSQGTEGGGMKLGHFVYGLDGPLPSNAKGNMITVENSYFSENSALQGGALSVSLSFQAASEGQLASVHLLGNTFEYNIAKLGAAIKFNRFGSILEGLLPEVLVEHCKFRHNSIQYAENIHKDKEPYQMGIGTVHVNEVRVWFKGNTTFENNNGSALSVISSVVKFTSCRAWFSKNKGDKGAAIALLGAAYMQVSNGTWMAFENNTATTEGGAIYNTYISRENLRTDSNCFVRHSDPFLDPDDWEVTFLFVFNTADNNYNAIHSTSILPCSVPGGKGMTNSTSRIFCWNGWWYSNQYHCHSQVTSDIGDMTFWHDQHMSAYSGWPFELQVNLKDDLNNTIKDASFTVTYNDTKVVTVYRKSSILVSGNPNTAVKLSVASLGNRVWQTDVIVDLKPCPAGFSTTNTNDSSIQCTCSGSYGGAVLCDDTSKTIQLLNGMWIGKLAKSDENYVVMDCPLHFCGRTTNDRYINISYIDTTPEEVDWDSIVCGGTKRTGINCGRCIDGMGPAINSLTYECVNCTDINVAANIATYVAAVYIPLAVLFTILIVFDIRLTTGPANAFILYCQMVTSTYDLNADGGIPSTNSASKVLHSSYRFPFGIFNLKFIENYIPPICFTANSDFNVMSILLMDYAVALFPLVMILVAILGLKASESCCMKNKHISVQNRRRLLSISRLASVLSMKNKKKKINDALLPAFASFLLLSYAKFSTTSSYILNSQYPLMESGQQVTPQRVYYASQLRDDSPGYLMYYIPAVVMFSTIVVFTPLILMEYPLKALEWCIFRVKCLKRVYPNDKIHLFLNMFQGCYRSRMRFFAGLYFLFRFVINLSYFVTSTWLQQFLVQQAAATIMISLLALCQPYEWKVLNYVDILIFTNMAILNSISFYLYSFTKLDPKLTPSSSTIAIQYILVFLPLIYMVAYILWNVTRAHHSRIKLAFQKRSNGYEPLSTASADKELPTGFRIIGKKPRMSFVDKREFEDDYEAMLSRAEDQNTYAPSLSKSVTFIEVSGQHTHGEANVSQTSISEDSSLQASPGGLYGATETTTN